MAHGERSGPGREQQAEFDFGEQLQPHPPSRDRARMHSDRDGFAPPPSHAQYVPDLANR